MASSSFPYTIEEVNQLDAADIEQLTAMLAVAYEKEALTLIVTDKDYPFFGEFWYSTVIAGFLAGVVYIARDQNGQIVGASVFFPPGREMYDSEDQQKQALGILFGHFSESLNAWWTTQFLPDYGKSATKFFGRGKKLGSWHLQTFAVHPNHQRKGIGKSMLNEVKKKAVLDKAALCVEGATQTNVEIYEKLGFVVKGESTYAGAKGSFTLRFMLQEVD